MVKRRFSAQRSAAVELSPSAQSVLATTQFASTEVFVSALTQGKPRGRVQQSGGKRQSAAGERR
ncbi:hypothetical protein ACVIJ6_007517 [Bradyrhizobium sp. USDA 4369]